MNLMFPFLRLGRNNTILVTLSVKPGSRPPEGLFLVEGQLLLRTSSRAVDGAANASVISTLADVTSLPKSLCEIVKGQTSQDKVIAVSTSGGCTIAQLEAIFVALPAP